MKYPCSPIDVKRFSTLILMLYAGLVLTMLRAQNIPHRAATGAMQDMMDNMGNQVPMYMDMAVDGVPFLAIQGGASLQFGEFARLRASFPGMTGFTLMGGIGKEMIFKRDYRDKLLWHAGIGYYWSDNPTWMASGEIVAAKTPSISDVGLMVNCELNWFFEKYRRLGAFVGFGVGLGELDRDDPKALWELSIGLTFKIFRK